MFFFLGGGGEGGCGYYDHAFNFHPSFRSASFPLFLFSFCFSVLVFLFWFIVLFCLFFCFGFLHHCHCKTTPSQEEIITLAPGVTSRYTGYISGQQSCLDIRPMRSVYSPLGTLSSLDESVDDDKRDRIGPGPRTPFTVGKTNV